MPLYILADANQHTLASHSGEKTLVCRTTSAPTASHHKGVFSPEVSNKSLDTDGASSGTSTNKDGGSGICIVCERDFGDLRNLSDHVQETHNYICEVCNR